MESHSTPLSRSPRIIPRILFALTCIIMIGALLLPSLEMEAWDVAAAELEAPMAAPAAVISHSGSIYYSQTGHTIKNGFLSYWLWNGQVAKLGYPLSEEVHDDGLTVQYFERARLEYNARTGYIGPSNVGSLLIADRKFAKIEAFKSTNDHLYVAETGHSIRGGFYAFYKKNGGAAVFGHPISQEFKEDGRTVQYFQRARFELTSKGAVQLGHIGAELMRKRVDAKYQAAQKRPQYQMSFEGGATHFPGNWNRIISLNQSWGNLPRPYKGYGLYAAMPADLNLYGRWGKVSKNGKSIWVQFIDVIAYKDIAQVRRDGKVIDLGLESFQQFAPLKAGVIKVQVDVAWPGEGPDK